MTRKLALGLVLVAACVAQAQPTINGGEVNISGATLFGDFFLADASTADWINADNDTTDFLSADPNCPVMIGVPYHRYNYCFDEPNPILPDRGFDQLAENWITVANGNADTWWLVQYRGVGSGNGLAEFRDYQLDGTIPTLPPDDFGVINRFLFSEDESITGACCVVRYADYDPNDPNWVGDPNNLEAPECEQILDEACLELTDPIDNPDVFSATFLGERTICEVNVCDPNLALGCCEYGDPNSPTRTRETAADCATLGGEWEGAGTICDIPCDASGTPYCQATVDLGVMDVPTRWFVQFGDPNAAVWSANPATEGYGRNPTTSYQGQSNKLKSLESSGGGRFLNFNSPADPNTVFDTPIAYVPIGFIANPGTGLSQARESELQHHFVTGRFPDGRNYIAATRDSGSGTRNGCMNSIGIDPSWGRGDNVGIKSGSSSTDVLGPIYQPTNKGGSSRMEGAVQNGRLALGYTGLYGGSRAIVDSTSGKFEIVDVMFDSRPNPGSQFVRPTVMAVLENCDPNTAYTVGGPETFASRGDPMTTDPNDPTYMSNQHAADYLRNIQTSLIEFGAPYDDNPEEDRNMPSDFLARDFFLFEGLDCIGENFFTGDPQVYPSNPNFNQTIQDFIAANQVSTTPAFGVAGAGRVPTRTDLTGLRANYTDGSVDGSYINPHNSSLIAGGSTLNDRNHYAADFAKGDGIINELDVELMMKGLYDRMMGTNTYRDDPNAMSSVGDPAVLEIIGDLNGDGNFNAEDARYLADSYLVTDATRATLSRTAVFGLIDQYWLAIAGDNNYFDTVVHDCQGTPLNDPQIAVDPDWTPGWSAFDINGNTPYPGAYPHGHNQVLDCDDLTYIHANFGDWTDINQAVDMDLSADMNGDLQVDEVDVYMAQAAVQSYCGTVTQAGDMNCNGTVGFDDINPFVDALVGGQAAYEAAYPCCTYDNGDFNETGTGFDDINPFVEALTGG